MNGWRLGAHRVVGRSPARAGRFPEPPTETPDPHRFTGAERITLTRVLSVAMLLTVVLLLSAHLDQDAAEAEAASDVASPLPPGILTGNLPATTSSSSTSTTSSTSTSTVTDPSTTSSTSSTTSSSVLPITTAPRAVPTTRASTIVTPIDDGTGGFRLRPGVAHAYPAYLIRFGNLVPPAVGAEVDFARQRINQLAGTSWAMGPATSSGAAGGEIVFYFRAPQNCGAPVNGDNSVFGCTALRGSSVEVEINPRIVGTGWQNTAILHELAHVAGLNDYDRAYAGSFQVMRTSCVSGLSDYQPGDRNGLSALHL